MSIDTEHFKEKLLAEKRVLEEELSGLGRQNPANPGDWETKPDETASEFRDEVADHLEEMDEREATEVELEARLKQVDHALQRLASGQYGICEVGQEPIEPERLEANPAARTCKAHLSEEDSLPLH